MLIVTASYSNGTIYRLIFCCFLNKFMNIQDENKLFNNQNNRWVLQDISTGRNESALGPIKT